MKQKITIKDKKAELLKMKNLLKDAYKISNNLIGDEESFSKNEIILQYVRSEIELAKLRIDLISYNDK